LFYPCWFYSCGNYPGFFLIGLLTALIFPYFSNTLNKAKEKKEIVTILTAISELKRNCITYLQPGEIEAHDNYLVFYLDNKEIERIYLPELKLISENIYFNRYGMTEGGELIVEFSRRYAILIEEGTGRISLE